MTRSKKPLPPSGLSKPTPARLLICDDQVLVRRQIREMLRHSDFIRIIGEALDGQDAVSLALKLKPDVILMDLSMPELNGIEATRQIVASAPEIAILAYSADSDAVSVRRMLAAGARGYLSKPATSSDLITALTKVLSGERYLSIGLDDPHY